MKKYIVLILVNYIFSYPCGLKANSYFVEKDSISQQVRALEKGDQVPDLEFTSLVNAKKQSLKLSDFKGMLVILDFWATWCSSCVAALPKINELQKRFKDQIQIIGVTDQKLELIEKFYSQRMEKQNFNLVFPTVTDNTVLANYWPHQTISHLVWINGEGKVIHITDTEEITEANIIKILKGDAVNLRPKTDRRERKDIDLNAAFILEKISNPIYKAEGVTEGGIRYKAIITKRIEGIRSGSIFNYTGRIIATNVPLESLFMNAYNYNNLLTGEFLFPFPINKLKWEVGKNEFYNLPTDSALLLQFRNNLDNYFCFEMVFPDIYNREPYDKVENENLKFIANNIMKDVLHKWTGFTSNMNIRQSKVLVLSISDTSKVISSISYEKSEIDPAFKGATFKNMRMLHFKRSLHHILQNAPPLIDETNYTGLVNLKLECRLTDIKALSSELSKYGLELKEEQRQIPLLVISN